MSQEPPTPISRYHRVQDPQGLLKAASNRLATRHLPSAAGSTSSTSGSQDSPQAYEHDENSIQCSKLGYRTLAPKEPSSGMAVSTVASPQVQDSACESMTTQRSEPVERLTRLWEHADTISNTIGQSIDGDPLTEDWDDLSDRCVDVVERVDQMTAEDWSTCKEEIDSQSEQLSSEVSAFTLQASRRLLELTEGSRRR